MGSFKFDDSGLKKMLKELEKTAEEISGEKSFEELFTPNFMNRFTNFSNFEELLTAGNFVVNSQEDFENIPDDEFDEHIRATTKFDSWEEMMNKAGEIYVEQAFKKF